MDYNKFQQTKYFSCSSERLAELSKSKRGICFFIVSSVLLLVGSFCFGKASDGLSWWEYEKKETYDYFKFWLAFLGAISLAIDIIAYILIKKEEEKLLLTNIALYQDKLSGFFYSYPDSKSESFTQKLYYGEITNMSLYEEKFNLKISSVKGDYYCYNIDSPHEVVLCFNERKKALLEAESANAPSSINNIKNQDIREKSIEKKAPFENSKSRKKAYCSYCGEKLDEKNNYCGICGEKID